MFKVTFQFESGEVVETFATSGENLLEVARKTNVAIDAPCSGNASCGKCRVKAYGRGTGFQKDTSYFRGRV